MYKKLTDFGTEVSLVANSTLQFLDFGLSIDEKRRGTSAEFAETYESEDVAQRVRLVKLKIDPETDRQLDEQSGQEVDTNATYSVNLTDALNAFDDVWLPFPYLKADPDAQPNSAERFKKGPTIWSRMRVCRLPEPDEDGNSHRLTIGFDTRVEQRREGTPYTVVSPSDVATNSQFEFASRIRDFSWYLDEAWVGGWLRTTLEEADSKGTAKQIYRLDDKPAELRHWALYITLIEGLAKLIDFPKVRFLLTIHEQANVKQEPPIDVDLILDIGNNRTCGILVEPGKGGKLGLEKAERLEIRDLEKLEFASSKPFQSRVEFRDAAFGKSKMARAAGGRDRVFTWPSPLRLGNEATRLNGTSAGSEGLSGLSAPKRYLWDGDEREQQWSFNVTGRQDSRPEIVGRIMLHVNDAGELLSRTDGTSYAFRARFSRASVFSMQVMEIVLHAIRQVNDVSYRWSRELRNVPRRLRRVILTIPSATPMIEQREFRLRANDGLDLIWEMLDWTDSSATGFEKPELRISYDEASCTQLVFLYSEMMDRFQKTAHEYIKLRASPMKQESEDVALRVASIDIGGGTTDLMIATYSVDEAAPHHLKLKQNFREGFRIAGDDIVQHVISNHVLKNLAEGLRAAGMADAGHFVKRMFDVRGSDARERQRQILFVNQVLMPIAYMVLERYEASAPGVSVDPISFDDGFDLDNAPPDNLIEDFDSEARDAGAKEFSLRTMRFDVNPSELSQTIGQVINENLQALTTVVAAHDCDYLLLTGRPSQLPAVRDAVLASMSVPAHRVVFMHEYNVGAWYPFVSVGGLIGDPKTTVAAGALICALAEDSHLTNFSLQHGAFSLASTANVIGLLDPGGALTPGTELFRRDKEGHFERVNDEFTYSQPVLIGFRQIDRRDWPATPLFRLHVPHDGMEESMRRSLPWKISLERRELTPLEERRGEQPDERFKVGSVVDRNGTEMTQAKRRLRLQLQTMLDEDGFWTDTGRLNIPFDL